MKKNAWKWMLAVSLGLVTISKAEAATSSSESFWDNTPSVATVSAGVGIAVLGGSTGWALNFGAVTRATESSPIYWGADVALNFWGTSPSLVSASTGATAVQLLPTVLYGFTVETLPGIYPYVGISAGPNIYMEKLAVGSSTTTSTSLLFELLFRIGANWQINRDVAFNFEPKIGILRSDLIFLPQINLLIHI